MKEYAMGKSKSLCNTQRNHQMKKYNLTEMMDCVKTEVNIKLQTQPVI